MALVMLTHGTVLTYGGRHRHLRMQMAVAGARDINHITETPADVTRSIVM